MDDGVELIWPGKRRPDLTLPVGPAPRRREACGAPGAGAGWRNRLDQGENGAVLRWWLAEHAGRVDLVYADPPFGTGNRHWLRPPREARGASGAGPTTDAAAFDDRWGLDGSAYLQFLYERLVLMKALLAPTGTLFLHLDPRMDWAGRCLVDEVFGRGRLLNQIVWHYTGGGRSRRYFSRKHDLLLWVANGEEWTFHVDAVRRPYRPTSGFARAGITARSGKRYLPHPAGTPVDDVWHIPIVNPMAGERNGYPTQKPERLLERILLAASSPGDLVADPFCGSGSTLAVAQRLGRRWLGCDSSPAAIDLTRERLAGSAFEVYELLEAPG
jgi:DNA modification methylase